MLSYLRLLISLIEIDLIFQISFHISEPLLSLNFSYAKMVTQHLATLEPAWN